jgi:hypothetical protein
MNATQSNQSINQPKSIGSFGCTVKKMVGCMMENK